MTQPAHGMEWQRPSKIFQQNNEKGQTALKCATTKCAALIFSRERLAKGSCCLGLPLGPSCASRLAADALRVGLPVYRKARKA